MVTADDVRAVALGVHARMAALDPDEMRELVTDAWRMCVPRKLAAAHLGC
jgi:hypothetical protein